ncbi:hypothetical protein DPMN_145638 [Dreissena polymorpha]|uniref:BTB domain-containing protein n=1 Tax=Dreissena polymorpha TaxID=45954 RepID=A0A9D4F5I7_DREPO|nr:hypothetical protein DPMN_145638 [Dreissena polymorpha]
MMHLNGLEKNLSSTSLEEMEEPEKEPIVYEDAKHTTNVLNSLRQMHKRGQFCDATLIVGEHELGIHRAVLAASSPYFFQLFESSDTDDSLRTFKLKGVQFERFKPLLDFMYTGRLQVAQDMVKAVYNLAQDLRIASASQACVEYLTTSLTPDNCLGIHTSVLLHMPQLLPFVWFSPSSPLPFFSDCAM